MSGAKAMLVALVAIMNGHVFKGFLAFVGARRAKAQAGHALQPRGQGAAG